MAVPRAHGTHVPRRRSCGPDTLRALQGQAGQVGGRVVLGRRRACTSGHGGCRGSLVESTSVAPRQGCTGGTGSATHRVRREEGPRRAMPVWLGAGPSTVEPA